MDSVDTERTVNITLPQHFGSNTGSVTNAPHHGISNDASSPVSRRVVSSKRKLKRPDQLAWLEQEVLSEHEKCQGRTSIKETATNVDIVVIPRNDTVSIVALNDIESSHRFLAKETTDIIVKRKTCERITIPAALFDAKLTIDMKIQKHIDLNLLPMNRPTSCMKNTQDLDSSILQKLKEQFHHPSIDGAINCHTNNVKELTHARTSGTDRSDRWNDLERGGTDDDKEDGDDGIEKPRIASNHVIDGFLEYDVMDESHRGLAVAVHIEDDSIADLPSAVQYDPNTKPFLYMTRRFGLLLYLIIISAINAVVGGCIGVMYINHNHHIFEAQYRTIQIRDNIERFIGKEQLDEDEAYHKALRWMTMEDRNVLTLDHAKIAQRYLVAYLYFATSTEQPWSIGCAPANNNTAKEGTYTTNNNQCRYSVSTNKIYEDDVNEETKQISAWRWLSERDVCEWAGIHCDTVGQIRRIDLGTYWYCCTISTRLFVDVFDCTRPVD